MKAVRSPSKVTLFPSSVIQKNRLNAVIVIHDSSALNEVCQAKFAEISCICASHKSFQTCQMKYRLLALHMASCRNQV
jgi:hypothetical protein